MVNNNSKKGQITLTFNWVYILIAGVIILLFFVGIVMTQKSISENRLSYDVVRILDSILTGATVSEKTKTSIDTSALQDFVIEFRCEIDGPMGDQGGGFKDIFSFYGLKDTSATVETPIEVIFSPKEIKTKELIVWSMPYKIPFKVIDFLFITSIDTKYFVIGDNDFFFREELKDTTDGLNIEFISDSNDIVGDNNFHVRIIDLGDNGQSDPEKRIITNEMPIPSKLNKFEESQISAVSFTNHGLYFYEVRDGKFIQTNHDPVKIIALNTDRNAAKFAAIFSYDDEAYRCAMMKSFERLKLLSSIYFNKLGDIKMYYENGPVEEEKRETCNNLLNNGLNHASFEILNHKTNTCVSTGYGGCLDLVDTANKVEEFNENLFSECTGVY
jgi:hypothetical protein